MPEESSTENKKQVPRGPGILQKQNKEKGLKTSPMPIMRPFSTSSFIITTHFPPKERDKETKERKLRKI
jgi:hypothetical protein